MNVLAAAAQPDRRDRLRLLAEQAKAWMRRQ